MSGLDYSGTPADADAVLTITTDRGTIEAWSRHEGDRTVAQARFVVADVWPHVMRYTARKWGPIVIGRPPQWFVDGEASRTGPYEQTYGVDLSRACDAALAMRGRITTG